VSVFASTLPIVQGAADAFRPPKRISVSAGAMDSLKIQQPGGYSGPWSPTETPYMVEPMDMLASRKHEALCFVGPARTGKTMGLLDGWFARNVTCDMGDDADRPDVAGEGRAITQRSALIGPSSTVQSCSS